MELNIGLLIPHSSSYTMLSQNIVRGIKLAFTNNNINANYIIEDIGKGSNAKEILGKANKLLVQDIHICFALAGHDSWQELNTLFSNSNCVLFLLDAGAKINLPNDFEPSVSTFIHSAQFWKSLYDLGKQTADKYPKILSTSSFFESGYHFLSAFAKSYQNNGGELVGYHSTQEFKEEDFKVSLAKHIDEGQPQALLGLYNGKDADEFYEKCVSKGYDKGLPLIIAPLGLGSGKIEIDNYTIASTWVAEIENEENRKFVQDYKAKYKKVPDIFAAIAYEAATVVSNYLETDEDWNAEKFGETAKSKEHQSIRGTFRYFETGETDSFKNYIITSGSGYTESELEETEYERVKEWEKEQVSSGWFNPYPCS